MEDSKKLSRRAFVKDSMVLAVAFPSVGTLFALPKQQAIGKTGGVTLSWLGGQQPSCQAGLTWGVPWRRGSLFEVDKLTLEAGEQPIPCQSWVTARWPDGSLKWTAHAVPAMTIPQGEWKLTADKRQGHSADSQLVVTERADDIVVDTGAVQFVFNKSGQHLIESVSRNGQETIKTGQLVLRVRNRPVPVAGEPLVEKAYTGEVESVVVEQAGPLRAVLKMTGSHHSAEGRQLLPYVVRIYLYTGATSLRMVHTMVYDADEHTDFISGLGLRFGVAMHDELHNRHIRFCGADEGVFGEAVRGLTGLRRDPGKEVRAAQVGGKHTGDITAFHPSVTKNIQYIPAFGDYTLVQHSPEGFEIKKRTKEGHGWLPSAFGRRAAGVGYVGGASGGIVFGVRNFWKNFPGQLDIRHAGSDTAEVTMWLWAPDAAPMDLRFYHDGMGQDTYEKQLDALDITYEDYEPEFGTPHGVAKTSELELWVVDTTPSSTQLVSFAKQINEPPMVVCQPDYYYRSGVFGQAFTPVDAHNEGEAPLEAQLDTYIDYYKKQVEQHNWYGFWNYGDFMHAYDNDRHAWRYDVGGFAWDNSELSTDLWLWYYFLRTGRYDVFRMAEAMTRHTGEVDVHHIGPFSPLGSRHNVHHWGCSAKQLRISTAANRRFYYFLTADERTGDLMREQLDAAYRLEDIVPGRKIGQLAANQKGYASIGFGTDWGALSSAWFTEWERTGDKQMEQRLVNSMQSIAAQPRGFFTGSGIMNLETGEFRIAKSERISVSHLSAAFGLPEICIELIENFDVEGFKEAWLLYCRLYNASEPEQIQYLGEGLGKLNLAQGHSKLTAYAAKTLGDEVLRRRAWEEFFAAGAGLSVELTPTVQVMPPNVLEPVDEKIEISTNAVAQWGLAAMQCLAFAGNPSKFSGIPEQGS